MMEKVLKKVEELLAGMDKITKALEDGQIHIFKVDTKKMLKSKAFQKDPITEAINDLNESLGFAKCRGIKLEVLDKFKETESLVNINGFIVRDFTLAHLILEGVVKVSQLNAETVKKID